MSSENLSAEEPAHDASLADTTRTQLLHARAGHQQPHTIHKDVATLHTSEDAVQATAISVCNNDEESILRCAQRELSAEHNRGLPVARLPTEVLTAIFALLVISSPPYTVCRRLYLGWIYVTHVSQRWRHVALECPSLWVYLPLDLGNKCLQAMLSRAKSAPLHFIGRVMTDENGRFVARNLHRAKTLFMNFGTTYSLIVDHLVEPAPSLDSLRVTVNGPFSAEPAPVGGWPLFPNNFLGGCAPNLRHLGLHTPLFLPWASPLLANLVTLTFSDMSDHMELKNISTLSEVTRALCNMKALRRLLLDLDLDTSEPADSANLSRLEFLSIDARMIAMRHLLEHLKIPEVAEAHFTIIDPPISIAPEDYAALFSAMATCRYSNGSHSAPLDHPYATYFMKCAYPSSHLGLDIWTVDENQALMISVDFQRRHPRDEYSENFHLASMMWCATEHLHHLGLEDLPPDTPVDMLEMGFRGATAVSALRIGMGWTLDLFLALPWRTAAQPILPSLSSLRVRNIDLNWCNHWASNQVNKMPLGDRLVLWLAERVAAGYPLDTLNVCTSVVSTECIEAMRKASPGICIFADTAPENADSMPVLPAP